MAMDVNELRFTRVGLAAPADALAAIQTFYGEGLGIRTLRSDESGLALSVGPATLEFVGVPGAARPFYHFALLVPGDRFDAAYRWIQERTELLERADSGETVFEFDFWNARACYFHDPAGSIVELIAHRGLAETSHRDGPFAATEIAGISEVGIVATDPASVAGPLQDELGLELWFGDVWQVPSLGFLGRQGHTLIVASAGRGWLPTGRAAEVHPVEVRIAGIRTGAVRLGEVFVQSSAS